MELLQFLYSGNYNLRSHATGDTVTLDYLTQLSITQASAAAQQVPLTYVSYVSAIEIGATSITATTVTNYPLKSGETATSVYSQLSVAVNASVSSGGFTNVLQQASIVNGANATASASATSVVSSDPVVIKISSGSSSALSSGAIAGIVIGVVIGKSRLIIFRIFNH